MWAGTVASEGVIELIHHRRPELHPAAIRLHFWIDLLVELPILAGVVLSGCTLVALTWPLTTAHLIKLLLAAGAVGANLICIILVIRRGRGLSRGEPEETLKQTSRRILFTALVGLPCAVSAVALGFWLASQRVG